VEEESSTSGAESCAAARGRGAGGTAALWAIALLGLLARRGAHLGRGR